MFGQLAEKAFPICGTIGPTQFVFGNTGPYQPIAHRQADVDRPAGLGSQVPSTCRMAATRAAKSKRAGLSATANVLQVGPFEFIKFGGLLGLFTQFGGQAGNLRLARQKTVKSHSGRIR